MNPPDAEPDSENRGGGATETLHIFALSSLALAQPLFDVYGQHAEFFVARRSQPVDVMLLVLAVSVLVPLAVVLPLAGLRRVVPGLYPYARSVALTILGTMALLPVAKKLPGAAPIVVVGIALGGGLLLAVGNSRYRLIRHFLTALSPAIVVVPLVFILATPVSRIVLPRDLRVSIPGTPQADHPVVFVVLDCLPTAMLVGEQGDIDAVRFPNMARLAQTAHWFRQARTVAINTERALPSLLTGRYRDEGTLPIAEHYPENLFTLQRWRGGMTVLESVSQLCPKSLQERRDVEPLMTRLRTLWRDSAVVYGHVVLPGKVSTWLPPVDDQWGSFGAPVERPGARRSSKALREKVKRATVRAVRGDSLARFEEFLSGLRRDGLSYLHLNLPHSPYLYLPSGKTYVPRGRLNRSVRLQHAFGRVRDGKVIRWTTQEYPVRLAYQRLVLQAALADRLLGRLLDRMVEVGMFDRSMVILVSDHGESFRPGEPHRTLEDGGTLHVPLLIKEPLQKSPEISDRAATLVDVLPTISDALDIEVPWRMDGTSLLRDEDEDGKEASTGWPEDLLSRDVRRSHDWVGFGNIDRVYRVGPFPELLGVAEGVTSPGHGSSLRLSWSKDPGVTVGLDLRARLAHVALDSSFIPVYLTGRLHEEEPIAAAMDLAVVVNGRIVATCRSFTEVDDAKRLAVLVPEASFRQGSNVVHLFAIRREGANVLQLSRLGDADSPGEIPPRLYALDPVRP